ncbi:hypothetical protein [Pseudoduganella sp. GCM10020061]|uniref:hypothetical protein n=1 Tax=Pseudoduganella sp. GCM10020061 TaxID=3317345 RepID=UPI00363733B3
MRRAASLFALALACCITIAAAPARAAAPGWSVVTADDSELTRRIERDLYARLARIARLPQKVTIAIGPVALRRAVTQRREGMVFSAYTSSQVLHQVIAKVDEPYISGIYAEPSPMDQLQLIALLYKRPVAVAAIVSAEAEFLSTLVPGLTLERIAPEGGDINQALNRVADVPVLLAWPDRAVFNSENVRNILLSTYRHGQGVIGFSADMVSSGALATTYSTPEDINIQIVETLAQYEASGQLGPPQFPRYFRTAINEGLARSLKVPVSDAARTFERRPGAAR